MLMREGQYIGHFLSIFRFQNLHCVWIVKKVFCAIYTCIEIFYKLII